MHGKMQKRIALLFVVVLLLLALVPAFYPLEDEGLAKDSVVYSVYGQLFAVLDTAYNFDCNLGWTRIFSTRINEWVLPHILSSTAETRAPPA
jgi:hypothetical protein